MTVMFGFGHLGRGFRCGPRMKKARHTDASDLGIIILRVSDISDAVFDVGSSSCVADPFLRMNRRRLQKGRPRRPRMKKARHTTEDASGLGLMVLAGFRSSDLAESAEKHGEHCVPGCGSSGHG